MNRSELIRLNKLIKSEIERRENVNKCLENPAVLEYLNLVGMSTEKLDTTNIREMLINILKDFEVKETNGIYVCTQAYDRDWHAPCVYYCEPDRTCLPDIKYYRDIETQEEIEIKEYSIQDFERSHTVLNPYNAKYNDRNIRENGYEEVKYDFFEECHKHGQYKAVQKVLAKYPRIGSFKK